MPSPSATRHLRHLAAVFAAASLAACHSAPPEPQGPFIPVKVSERPVYVVELGEHVAGQAARIVSFCSDVNVVCIPLKPLRLDPRAMDTRSNAFAADALVEEVHRQQPVMAEAPGTIIVAVTAADMFVRERPERSFAPAWDTQDRFAVISLRQLGASASGVPDDPTVFTARLRKVVFRTLGRVFFRLQSPAESKGLMRASVPDLAALDALPDAFTYEDLNPTRPGTPP